MKLKTNFIYGAERFRVIAYYAAWALVAACLGFVLFFAFSGVYMRTDMASLDKKLDLAKAEYASMPPSDRGPDRQSLETLREKVAGINRLKMGSSEGISRILASLEKITPEGIYFTGISYNLEDNAITMDARTSSAGKISDFMEALEKEPLFRQVSLEKQSQRESATGIRVVDFSVRAAENLR